MKDKVTARMVFQADAAEEIVSLIATYINAVVRNDEDDYGHSFSPSAT